MHNKINGWHTHTEAQVVHRKLETTWHKQNLKGTYHHAALLHCIKKTPLYGISPDLSLSALVLWTVTAVSLRMHYRIIRVWKGIFGIWDLTKIWCGNQENDKNIDGIRDLTVPREAGLAKNWARDTGFMFACLSGMPETFKNSRKFKISIERINLYLTFISFCRN